MMMMMIMIMGDPRLVAQLGHERHEHQGRDGVRDEGRRRDDASELHK